MLGAIKINFKSNLMNKKLNPGKTTQYPKKEPEIEPLMPEKPEVPLPEIAPFPYPNKPEESPEPEIQPLPKPEVDPEKLSAN